jgi:hypothetical protein
MSNLLTNVIVWVYGKYKNFFAIRDYAVSKIFLEYAIDQGRKYEIEDKFWADEEEYWLDEEEFYIDVTRRPFRGTEIPQNVVRTICRVHYWHGGERYKHCSYDMDFAWPPARESQEGMKFTLPITSAVLVDEDDKPKRDVTRKIKRYAGPSGDFHGERILLKDLLYYDEDTLAREYPKIQITNALGIKKVIPTTTGYTTDLLSP